jgi:hypothetical protein
LALLIQKDCYWVWKTVASLEKTMVESTRRDCSKGGHLALPTRTDCYWGWTMEPRLEKPTVETKVRWTKSGKPMVGRMAYYMEGLGLATSP